MYCSKCGKEIFDDAIICPGCGCATGNPLPSNKPVNGDASSIGYAILGFFFPLIGLILFLVWKNELPLRAKSCGKGALIGVITNVALYVIMIIGLSACIGMLAGLETVCLLPFII
ncbi:MAG: zinc ribbon domain-containing protein [Clostridiales bacterium]|nr:zinc ribbon domain-containing protein [Clostridiales bacterium]